MAFRNFLYDKGIKKTHSFSLPVISVGNLTVGGTGKTPHTEYLIRLLGQSYRIATLSRGYGRKTEGFIIADETATAERIGDEPMQLYRKFAPQTLVTVGEKRTRAIDRIRATHPEIQAVLLDDAYQHRSVQPSLSILLTDYHRPFYQDYVLPAGRLRESRGGARRADLIIVTKCPADLPEEQQTGIIRRISPYASADTPVFFTGIRYGNPVAFGNAATPGQKALLVTGLADASPVKAFVQQQYALAQHLDFPDHYAYQPKDLENVRICLNQTGAEAILTTEKDYVKMLSPALVELAQHLPFFYIPIEVYFLKKQLVFDDIIRLHCQLYPQSIV